MEGNFVEYLITAIGSMATAISIVYHGRISDLRATIKYERDENRALVERLFARYPGLESSVKEGDDHE